MIKIVVIMNPIEKIDKLENESTFRIIVEAQRRNWEIFYAKQTDLFLDKEQVFANLRSIKVIDETTYQYELQGSFIMQLKDIDVILMRIDPPFNMNYIYTTYLLEAAERDGVLVVNKPQSLRDANEKLFTMNFPQCCPSTLVTSDIGKIKYFLYKHKEIIVKSLDGLGGSDIFYLTEEDLNINVILAKITEYENTPVMVQRFLPEIEQGDKRIVLIDGKPVPYTAYRIPINDKLRVSRKYGRKEIGKPLNKREKWLCDQIEPVLKSKGLIFVGLDIIGDYITEINVTSPGWLHDLDKHFNVNVSAILLDVIEKKLNEKII